MPNINVINGAVSHTLSWPNMMPQEPKAKTTHDIIQKPAMKPLGGLHVSTLHPPSAISNSSYSLPSTTTHSPGLPSPHIQSPIVPIPLGTSGLFPSTMQPPSPMTPILQPPVIHATLHDSKEKQMTITTVKNKRNSKQLTHSAAAKR